MKVRVVSCTLLFSMLFFLGINAHRSSGLAGEKPTSDIVTSPKCYPTIAVALVECLGGIAPDSNTPRVGRRSAYMENSRMYIQFDVSEIPDGAIVESVWLWIYC